MREIYADRGSHKVVGVADENRKLQYFIIADRQGETVVSKRFRTA